MADINTCIFSGHIAREVSFEEKGGRLIAKIVIGNSKSYPDPKNKGEWVKKTSFIMLFATGKVAESIQKKKPSVGDAVLVECRYDISYGDDNKVTWSGFSIKPGGFDIHKRKNSTTKATSEDNSSEPPNNPFGGDEVSPDDDIPF